MRRVLLLPLAMGGGCLVSNPEYDPRASAGATSAGPVGSTDDVSVGGADSHSTTSADAASGSGGLTTGLGDTGPGTSGAPVLSTSSDSSSGGRTTSSSSGGSTDTGRVLQPIDLGQSCAESDGCMGLGANVECCETGQCLDTCMVPCVDAGECPFDGMGCEHGYCLFPCDATDEDCADWPGFTCQHGLTYCENDGTP